MRFVLSMICICTLFDASAFKYEISFAAGATINSKIPLKANIGGDDISSPVCYATSIRLGRKAGIVTYGVGCDVLSIASTITLNYTDINANTIYTEKKRMSYGDPVMTPLAFINFKAVKVRGYELRSGAMAGYSFAKVNNFMYAYKNGRGITSGIQIGIVRQISRIAVSLDFAPRFYSMSYPYGDSGKTYHDRYSLYSFPLLLGIALRL